MSYGRARDLESKALQLATLLQSLATRGGAARKLARDLLLANGEDRTDRLNETERLTASAAEYLAVVHQLQAWIAAVAQELNASPPAHDAGVVTRSLPPKGTR